MANGLFNLKQVNQAISQNAWATGTKPTAVDYLVVAGGGGGGGANIAGGGGAGGLLQGTVPVTAGSAITVTVGAGGTGGAGGAGSAGGGTNGSNSVFGAIASLGGGYGGGYNNGSGTKGNGGTGGSGGGGGQGYVGSPGTIPQGNGGGTGSPSAANTNGGGGGGGAGTKGIDASPVSGQYFGGTGGAGIFSAISGTVTGYGGGGGGGLRDTNAVNGGVGGGGNSTQSGSAAGAGTANTGGGGGGASGSGNGTDGGTGGSGIVIISYPDTYAAASATTGSPTVSTSGSGSLSLNGTTQYLSFANTTVLQLSGDFTIEGWFYISGSTGFNQIAISKWSSPNGYILYYDAAQSKYTFVNNAVTIASSTTQSFGQYYHLAVTKSGNNYVLYVNGTSVGTASSSTTPLDSATQLEIGRNSQSSNNWLNGYASNVRIVKGTAVYTGNFTPSTTPLTAVANTSLLLNTVSGAPYADSSTNSLATNTTTSLVGSWNASSPFTVTGYKNRVYTWTSSGSITF